MKQGAYVVDTELMEVAPSDMIVMHPLPRVDEISTDVDSDPRACYFRQMENGMFTRMAILALVLGKPWRVAEDFCSDRREMAEATDEHNDLMITFSVSITLLCFQRLHVFANVRNLQALSRKDQRLLQIQAEWATS